VTKKKTKRTYRLRNWKEYNASLVARGSLTVWVRQDVIESWQAHERTGRRGAPRTYTDTAILCMATLEEVYHLPLRATQGLMRSIQLSGKRGYSGKANYSTDPMHSSPWYWKYYCL
jgi:hypothetical protein